MTKVQGGKVSALLLLSIGTISLSFVPGLRGYAAIFWGLGFVLILAALVLVMRLCRRHTGLTGSARVKTR